MQLYYRGVPYQKNPTTIPPTEYEMIGKYRGRPWRKSLLKDSLSIEGFRQLKYRGISYISPVLRLKQTDSISNHAPQQGVLNQVSVPLLRQRLQSAIANGATYFQIPRN